VSAAQDFLVEIGTEELPPKALRNLAEQFGAEMTARLRDAGLKFGEVHTYATPRRLAVAVGTLAVAQPTQRFERRGPAVGAAFDSAGQPTAAALGFARSCGVEFSALGRLETDKGQWLVYRGEQAGRAAAELLPEIVAASLAALPIPKRMRWGAGDDEFVRPVHWLVMLHGTAVVPSTILGVSASDMTRGHRFMGAETIVLRDAAEYCPRLEHEGRVLADFAVRRARVHEMVVSCAQENGGRALFDDMLLDEVTALVEWPVPIVGSFDPHFLAVPREALVATMQGNQKYFPLEDATGRLLNRFVTISNIESPHPEFIRDGNERVIRPRLSDAAFFFDKDRRTPLAARGPALASIVFERRLGSLLDKTERVARLAGRLAPLFGADQEHAERAAALSRCDLLSEMVGEFPELQGTMGRYYALDTGELPEVAAAIGEFYQPRFAGDALPVSNTGRCLACADRLDSLLGIFSIGGAPSGDKDPYALRRAALGCLRICIEAAVPLDLEQALAEAAACYAVPPDAKVGRDVLDFVRERSRAYFGDRGVRADVVEAVLATRPSVPLDLARRVTAVEHFSRLPQAEALAAANKRIANILRKAETGGDAVEPARLVESAEQALYAAAEATDATAASLLSRGDYTAYLEQLAALHDPVNAFFDRVLVMADDASLRANRLALLGRIHAMFLRVADIALVSSQ
jgi:glycyl-tRNA synthetase beta chain